MGQPVTVLHRALDALLVQPQGVIHDAFFRFKATDHVIGIGPSRDSLRIDERSDLNLMQAGFGQGVDQLDLTLRRDRSGLDLEALAGAFFLNIDFRRHVAHRSLLHSIRPFNALLAICVPAVEFTVSFARV